MDLNELPIYVPGLRLGDKLDKELERIACEIALEQRTTPELQKRDIKEFLAGAKLSEASTPPMPVPRGRVKLPAPAPIAANDDIGNIIRGLEQLIEERRQ